MFATIDSKDTKGEEVEGWSVCMASALQQLGPRGCAQATHSEALPCSRKPGETYPNP